MLGGASGFSAQLRTPCKARTRSPLRAKPLCLPSTCGMLRCAWILLQVDIDTHSPVITVMLRTSWLVSVLPLALAVARGRETLSICQWIAHNPTVPFSNLSNAVAAAASHYCCKPVQLEAPAESGTTDTIVIVRHWLRLAVRRYSASHWQRREKMAEHASLHLTEETEHCRCWRAQCTCAVPGPGRTACSSTHCLQLVEPAAHHTWICSSLRPHLSAACSCQCQLGIHFWPAITRGAALKWSSPNEREAAKYYELVGGSHTPSCGRAHRQWERRRQARLSAPPWTTSRPWWGLLHH